jgi:hemerythrin-like metal-binding protein
VKISSITTIDQQHQELVNKLNRLSDAVKVNEARRIIYQIIDEVIEFTRLHFETEEQLMIQSEYPDIEWHKDKHKQLIEDALRLRKKLDYIGEEMFTDWFNHWPFSRVLAHIQFADKQLLDNVQQRNVEE